MTSRPCTNAELTSVDKTLVTAAAPDSERVRKAIEPSNLACTVGQNTDGVVIAFLEVIEASAIVRWNEYGRLVQAGPQTAVSRHLLRGISVAPNPHL